MRQKITPEFCKKNILIFYPKTGKESKAIQKKIFDMGFGWIKSGQKIVQIEKSLSKGMVLEYGSLFIGSERNAIVCNLDSFEGGVTLTTYVPKNKITGMYNQTTKSIDNPENKMNMSDQMIKRINNLEKKMNMFDQMIKRINSLENEMKNLKNPTHRNLDKPKRKQGI